VFEIVRLDAHNPGPMTGSGNNTYLLGPACHERAAILVDAGVGDARHLSAIDDVLRVNGARLERVIVTHAHADHASGVEELARRYPGTVFLKHLWQEADRRYSVPWQPLIDGDTADVGGDRLTIVHTPGHSPDHIVVWHAATLTAFTGDLVIAGGSVMIQASRGGSMAQYMASLERMLALEPARLLPAHGDAINDPADVLNAYLQHRRMRERQVVEALAAGRDTVPAIADSIYDGLSPELMAAAQENVVAHLDKLKTEGRASEDHGRWRLRLPGVST